MNSREALWARLRTDGLVEGECPPPPAAAAPWYVRVMLGFAGWIAATFLLMFVGAALPALMQSAGASLLLGLMVCGGAAALFRARPDHDFLGQFGFALSLAGQALVLMGLARALGHDNSATAFGMALFEAALFALIGNPLHRVWSAATAAGALAYALADAQLQDFAPGLLAAAGAFIWLQELQQPQAARTLRAAGYGLLLAMLLATVAVATLHGWQPHPGATPGLAGSALLGAGLSGLVLVGTVFALLGREGLAPTSGGGLLLLAGSALLALANLKAPGLAPTLLVLLLGVAQGNRLLSGLGIAALLGYLSFYYYSLQFTLLQKSLLLAATGGGLLLARLLLHRVWPERAAHA